MVLIAKVELVTAVCLGQLCFSLHTCVLCFSWSGRHLWGISVGDVKLSYVPDLPISINRQQNKWIVISTHEGHEVQAKMRQDFSLCYAAGAGYKILCVADQLVCAYLLTEPTCYKWDTCAPHAILQALGGGIVDCNKALEVMRNKQDSREFSLIPLLEKCSISYSSPDTEEYEPGAKWVNAGGIIAFDSYQSLIKILQCLLTEVQPTDEEGS